MTIREIGNMQKKSRMGRRSIRNRFRKSFGKELAVGMMLVCLVSAAVTGCADGKYEKIAESTAGGRTAGTAGETDAARKTEAAGETDAVRKTEAAEIASQEEVIVIGSQSSEAADIIIEAADEKAGTEAMGGNGSAESAGGPSGAEAGREPEQEMQETQEMQENQEEMKLLFAGDVLLSDHVLRAYENGGGIEGVLDEEYRQLIADTDFFFVNEEFPFSGRGTQAPDKQFTFRLPPEKVQILWQMGVDGVSLANNHALDYGTDALLDSCQVLDNAGILHTGAGENLAEAKKAVTVEIDGKKIGIIGATRVIPVADWAAGEKHPGMLATYDPSVLLEEIRRLRQENDYVIVYVHWGIERDEKPQEYQRTMGKQYIDAGADLVIGAHPHVLQGLEYYKGKAIVYSLGNFVFGSSIPRTALLQVTGDLKLRLIPGTSSAGFTRRITDPEKCREFYQYMEGISYGVRFQEDGAVVGGE